MIDWLSLFGFGKAKKPNDEIKVFVGVFWDLSRF